MTTCALFIIGPPGAGKTALATHLATEIGAHLISPDEWLRRVRDRKTPLAHYVRNNYTQAALDPLVTQYVEERIALAKQEQETVVVDGFPATPYQVRRLPLVCDNQPFHVFHIANITPTTALARIHEREYVQRTTPHVLELRNNAWLEHRSEVYDRLAHWSALSPVDGRDDVDTLAVYIQDQLSLHDLLVLVEITEERDGQYEWAASSMQRAAILALAVTLSGTNHGSRARFVGSHPLSLQRCHFDNMRKHRYVVSHKVDGQRALLIVHSGHIWFINRNLDVTRTPFSPTLRTWESVMLDVELLQRRRHCIVLDALHTRTEAVDKLPIRKRLFAVRHFVRLLADYFECGATVQRYYDLADLDAMLDVPGQFPTDGLCLIPARLPYRNNHDHNSFKWKAPRQNTIDLHHVEGTLYMRSNDMRDLIECGALIDPDAWPDNAVLECIPISDSTWKASRVRDDKPHANPEWVVRRILESIHENITLAELRQLSRYARRKLRGGH